ncbi:MAG: hypothetical protein C5B60_05875, partial [Chloroflexi bacterium]
MSDWWSSQFPRVPGPGFPNVPAPVFPSVQAPTYPQATPQPNLAASLFTPANLLSLRLTGRFPPTESGTILNA